MLRQIGEAARMEIERMTGTRGFPACPGGKTGARTPRHYENWDINCAKMIVSFHPIIAGDKIHLRGPDPGPKEADAIKTADAVILPQGCRWSLYEMAAAGCRHVFPDYRARFRFPGKPARPGNCFPHFDLPHPRTRTLPVFGIS
ncbi:MAG: hypothetical protein R2875_12470 [Desulfobacterales bacterium]